MLDTHSSGRWTTVEHCKLQNTHEMKRNPLLLVNSRVKNPESSLRIAFDYQSASSINKF
jgi:hypothetical protein